ncbi:hypothetical protein GCM10020220_093800 [Nonomuraea rubra]
MTAAIAATVLLTSCGASGEAGREGTPPPATATPAAPAPEAAPSSEERVPDVLRFTATTLDGQKFDGASLAGKPVVFWFWAPVVPQVPVGGPPPSRRPRRSTRTSPSWVSPAWTAKRR